MKIPMLPIHVAAANLSLFNMNHFYLDHETFKLPTEDYSIIETTGLDTIRFLNGQTTTDVSAIPDKEARLSTKVDRSGRLLFAFYILKDENVIYLLTKKDDQEELLEEFNKFIIMDDVSMISVDLKINILIGGTVSLAYKENRKMYSTSLLSYPALIILGDEEIKYDYLDNQKLDELVYKSAGIFFERNFPRGTLINSTLYMEEGIDLDKGCYLGQETIKKIESNRGAATYPCLIEVKKGAINPVLELKINEINFKTFKYHEDEKNDYLAINLPRDLRVDNMKVRLTQENEVDGLIKILPILKKQTPSEIGQRLFYEGVEQFQHGYEEEAEKSFRKGIIVDPSNPDIFESLGVLLGRNNKFEEAISLMDELLKISPESVMAHTNKSLYLMRIGKIEEAEEEKALATVNSFKALGKEANQKKRVEEEAKKLEADLQKKESMFKQVLEIDALDIIANFGLGEITYKRKEYDLSKEYLKTALTTDPTHSKAYVVLGKVYEALEQKDLAITTYEQGIKVASKKGEMMPANEMQSRLISIQRVV